MEEASVLEQARSETKCQYYLAGNCRFGSQCRNLHSDLPAEQMSSDSKAKKKNSGVTAKVNKGKNKISTEETVLAVSTKKPSMKTSSDVISRLQWDSSLPRKNFVVGYLDRFLGVMEKPFDSLDWNDPSTVDNYTLAIPKHRIQYFKYKNKRVWDKNTRLDIIFGSTGSSISIYDFMKQVDSDKASFFEEDMNLRRKKNNGGDDASSEDSDSSKEDQRTYEEESIERPNFFIAARIVDSEIVKNFQEITNYIKEKDSLLGECCSANEILHLTLTILKLDSPGEISEAVKALQALKEKLTTPVEVHLETLDIFRHRVLFACVQRQDDLLALREQLVQELSERKLTITDRFSFVPHVTVAKISRPVACMRHSKYIDQYLYLSFEDRYFGSQIIDRLCLCEMGEARREDGFYMCAAEVDLL